MAAQQGSLFQQEAKLLNKLALPLLFLDVFCTEHAHNPQAEIAASKLCTGLVQHSCCCKLGGTGTATAGMLITNFSLPWLVGYMPDGDPPLPIYSK